MRKMSFVTKLLGSVLLTALMVPSLTFASAQIKAGQSINPKSNWDNTFSIAARDPKTGALAAAVSTARYGVGNRVPFVEYNVGVVNTQANTNIMLAKDAFKLLRKGATAKEALQQVLNKDPEKETRQLAILDAKGGAAAFTGTKPDNYKNHIIGKDCIVAGNILVGPETLSSMLQTFESTSGTLGDRVMAALEAAQKAGGDRRGKLSAAIIVAYAPESPYSYVKNINLRVDNSTNPVGDLRIVYEEYKKAFKIK